MRRTTTCRSMLRAAWISFALTGAFVVPLVTAPIARAESAPACFGKAATVVGTASDDRLDGTEGDDVIVGLGGRTS